MIGSVPKGKTSFQDVQLYHSFSAPVELLFSVGGGIFTPKSNMLGDGVFEKLLLLKGARKKLSYDHNL